MNKIPAAGISTGNAIAPIDGRNYHKIKELSNYFSEFALVRYRIKVEVEYLIFLSELKIFTGPTLVQKRLLRRLYQDFDMDGFKILKTHEVKIKHDVKAVEYYLREMFGKKGLSGFISYIHLFLTSEDVNNLAYALILNDFKNNILCQTIDNLIKLLSVKSIKWKKIPLLARTHGQPAVPTTVGKELVNYRQRIDKLNKKLKIFDFEGKLNGAVGNLNAQKAILPKLNWVKQSRDFVSRLGLTPNSYTTQILFYDNWMEFFQTVYIINSVLIDFSVNTWLSIMMSIYIQDNNQTEVGSSTMPQKVNPINFEHAEGNLTMANSMMELFIRKMPLSRLQRDLSDSTIRRNFGESLAYSLLGWKSIVEGIKKISPNETFLKHELENHWEILGEVIQTALRLKGDDKAYEKLKKLTKGRTLDKKTFKQLIIDLGLGDNKIIMNMSPLDYTGYAEQLVDNIKNSKT